MFPLFPNWSIPGLPLLSLSDDERALITELNSADTAAIQRHMEVDQAYYLGEQVIQNLRISVPKELEFLHTVVGWAALAVDPYVERLAVDCLRLASNTDANDYLTAIWSANNMAAELPLAVTDALSMGRGFWTVGSPLSKGDAPRITVDSPLNMTVKWDLRGIDPVAAFHRYQKDGRLHATLLIPFQTIHLATDDDGQWVVTDRDQHGFDFVPVVRMANSAMTNVRHGRSAISTPLKSIINSTCRTLLGLEVAREIYSVPQKLILGATENDFVKADGTPKSAWDTYIMSVLALERDENGNVPEVKQMQAYDPSVFTKLVEMAASQAAAIVAAPPQDMGLYTQGNPVSAEAQNTAEARRNRRARLQQATFGASVANVMRIATRFDNRGALLPEFRAIEVDWRDVEEYSPAIMSDAITKQIAVKAVPPRSDVTLKRLGYSAVERARLARDWEAMPPEPAPVVTPEPVAPEPLADPLEPPV